MRNVIMGLFWMFGLVATVGLSTVSLRSYAAQDYSVYEGQKIYHCKTSKGTVFQGQPCAGDRPSTQSNYPNKDQDENVASRVTFNFKSITIGDLLKIISQVAGYHLQLDDGQLASTRIDVRYINVPWSTVLNDVSSKYNFRVSFNKQDMIVTTAADMEYESLVDKLESRYPQVNPQSPAYDQSVVNEIQREITTYQQQNPGVSAAQALEHVYPTVLAQDTAGSVAPVNAAIETPSGDQARRYFLHSLGKMLPPFLLGVLVIGVIWGGIAFVRRRRGS